VETFTENAQERSSSHEKWFVCGERSVEGVGRGLQTVGVKESFPNYLGTNLQLTSAQGAKGRQSYLKKTELLSNPGGTKRLC